MVLEGEYGVHFEKIEDGVYGIVATAGDVQVGWCRQQSDRWVLIDTDDNRIVGNFDNLPTAMAEGLKLFAHLAGLGNPGH